jgi:mannitol/fructose-specific phosphotransferase system IIA component (Ntr-type)
VLRDLLEKKGHLLENVTCKNWEELVDILAAPMLEDGTVSPEFVESVKEAVHQFGPYMVLIEDIAFFHGRPEAGVKEVDMTLALLKEPIYLQEKRIKTAFLFAALDNDSHIDLLKELSEALNDDECVELLINGDNPKAILNKFKKGGMKS